MFCQSTSYKLVAVFYDSLYESYSFIIESPEIFFPFKNIHTLLNLISPVV